jgi:hypothetical protein
MTPYPGNEAVNKPAWLPHWSQQKFVVDDLRGVFGGF